MSPIRQALTTWVAVMVLTAGGGALTRALLPDTDGTVRALLVTEVMLVALLVARARWWTWEEVGVNRPAAWRHRGLLVLPALVALSPLVLGLQAAAEAGLMVLVVGYLLTGFNEELLWRGIVQRQLAPTGAVRSVVLTAALFGASHLANVFYRDSVALVLAQAWGAFCFGLAYSALRRRIGSIVPLMVLHTVTDLAAAVGALPKIPVLVAEDVVLLTLGVVLLAREHRATRDASQDADVRPVLLADLH